MERTVEDLEQELKAEHGLYLRALADFENYRRRIERERDQLGKEALRTFILPILDLADDLERSLSFAQNETSPVVEGIRAVYQKLVNLLEAAGVRPFESVGQRFDPSQHEAVASAPAGEHTPGTIVQEVRHGYRWDHELLRSARVVVAV